MACISPKDKLITCLPENIIFEILSFLPVKERCIAGRVCKHWRQIIASNSLWRHVDLKEYRLNLPKMWKILRAHFTSSLLSLRIAGSCHRNSKASVSDALMKDLQSRCPNINTLELNDCNTSNLSLDCIPPGLTHFLVTSSSWQPRWLRDGHLHLTNLVTLDLSSSVRVDNFDLKDIAQWTNLRSISLCGCYRVKGSDIEVIAKSCKSLEILHLGFTGVDELGIHHIARHCSNLKELYLQRCCNMRDSWLSEIVCGLKNLEVLDVNMCENFSVEALKGLWSLKKLKLLNFSTRRFKKDDSLSIKSGFNQDIQFNKFT